MKNLLFIKLNIGLLFFILSLGSCQAQDSNSRANPEVNKEQLKKEFLEYVESLNLNEEQKTTSKDIHKIYFTDLKSLKNSEASKLDKYRSYKKLLDNKNLKMKKLLSKEQYKLYIKKQKEFQKKMKEYQKKKSNSNS